MSARHRRPSIVAIVLCLLGLGAISCATEPARVLLPAPADSGETLWGFIDDSGDWAIEPRFQDAYRFRGGLARVELDGKWGYVNEKGALVVEAQFTEAHDFSEGLARVATGPLLDPSYTFKVLITASGYGFIDKTGTMVIRAVWDDAGDFSDGLAAVMQGDACGYIDTKGKPVIPLEFAVATPFSEGLAAVGTLDGNETGGSWGYVDTTGRWVVGPTAGPVLAGVADENFQLPARRFANGLAPVWLGEPYDHTLPPDGGWNYIDTTGATRSWGPAFRQAGEFSEGLAPVQDGVSGKWGFIDTSGHFAIQPRFDDSITRYLRTYGGFHQGLAIAVAGSDVGYIDKTGEWVIEPQFAGGGGFSDGFAYVYPWSTETTTSAPSGLDLPPVGPLQIIDLTGRVLYRAPVASANGAAGSL
jgi:hypothetical protein